MIVIPRARGGWWHHYVCPTHGTELEHVGLLGGEFPSGGVPCRHGCRWDTPDIRGAWTVLAHQACARAADATVLKEYERLYLSLGGEHEGAQPWMLRGRLFHQALTEAIWAVSIGRAAWRHGNPVPKLLEELASAAFEARKVLLDRGDGRSNYVAWLNAAGAVCSGDPMWLDFQRRHMEAAILGDGWEWEGSSYYHGFVLDAYEATFDEAPESMRRVAEVFGGTALHDSPYVNGVGRGEGLFPDMGYAVFDHAGIRAIVDFGPHGGSHGHRDKLALYLYPWQPDPGQVPYGQKGWRDYYASTKAHPTFRVDDLEQAECTGRLVDANTFACDEAYEGVRAVRRVTPIDGGLRDELTVTCDRPRKVTLQLRPAVALEANGFETRWLGERVLAGRHECDRPSALMVIPGPGPADDPQRTVSHVDWTTYDVTNVTFRSEYRCLS
ncbi:MAG TPA: heparinase II/III family protein [Candidatus Limnocylindrales bacterium]